MGVYRTVLKKDAFITTQFPDANTGVDEILSLGSSTISDGTRVVQRILVEPDVDNVKSFLSTNESQFSRPLENEVVILITFIWGFWNTNPFKLF